MTQISGHINHSNHKMHSYDQMVKMIVTLSNKKWENNNKSTVKINQILILLLLSIVETPEMYVSNVNRNEYKRKICTSLIKSSSTLFSVSIEFIVLKINVLCWGHLFLQSIHQIFLPYYENIFSEKRFNKLHAWIKNHSHIIQYPN